MAWLEERPIQRLLEAMGPQAGSIMPGPEGQSLTVEPPPAPSGLVPSRVPAATIASNFGPAPDLIPSHRPPWSPPAFETAAPSSGGGIMPPETPAPAAMPKSAADLARADAMNEWRAHQEAVASGKKPPGAGFSLSSQFFALHPEVSGGVFIGPDGPRFLFHENKPSSVLPDQINSLISKYTQGINSLQGLQGQDLAKALWALPNMAAIGQILNPQSTMMTAQTGALKAPSEIAQNTANANRAQVVNVPIGPESQTGAFSLVPGQSPKQFATGTPAVTKPPAEDFLTNKILPAMIAPLIEQSMNPLLPPEDRAKADQKLASILQYAQGRQTPKPGGATPQAKPTLQEFLIASRPKNKAYNDAELTKKFYEIYGR